MGAANPFMFDPFAVLGLPRTYALDLKTLEKSYFEAQRKSHPDQFAGASFAIKQEASQKSAALNQAYVTLKDPLRRAECLLSEEEAIIQDPEFLMQMLEWQDQKERGDLSEATLKAHEDQLLRELERAFEQTHFREAKIIVNKLNYLKRLIF